MTPMWWMLIVVLSLATAAYVTAWIVLIGKALAQLASTLWVDHFWKW